MDILQQLALLKELTVTTGVIHEAQALQIRNYPLLIDGVQKATAQVDTHGKVITYFATSDDKKFKINKRRRFAILEIEKALKTILWDDTVVVLHVNDVLIKDSRNEQFAY